MSLTFVYGVGRYGRYVPTSYQLPLTSYQYGTVAVFISPIDRLGPDFSGKF
jgi:hypothetical protein